MQTGCMSLSGPGARGQELSARVPRLGLADCNVQRESQKKPKTFEISRPLLWDSVAM